MRDDGLLKKILEVVKSKEEKYDVVYLALVMTNVAFHESSGGGGSGAGDTVLVVIYSVVYQWWCWMHGDVIPCYWWRNYGISDANTLRYITIEFIYSSNMRSSV